MYIDKEEFKKKHKGDIPTLWKIYTSEKKFYQNIYFKASICFSIFLLFLSLVSNTPSYTLIIKVVNSILNLLPSLLGFNLGAYILIVGFASNQIFTMISQPLEGKKNFSLYQKLNGVLGIAVIVQILSLLTSFSINLWDGIQENLKWQIKNSYIIGTINFIGLFIVIFFSVYSIMLLVNVVKHVFLFAQTVQFINNVEDVKNKMNENVKNADTKIKDAVESK